MPPSMQISPPLLAGSAASAAANNNNQEAPARDGEVLGFYRGLNVLLTGATGFMGKVLLEKLLRSCPDLGTVYVLIRAKKGQAAAQRAEAIFDGPLFARLRDERPKFRHQVVAVAGDCSLPGLGLSPEDRAMLADNVNLVFHCAATVRFDEALDVAVNINVRGTRCVLDLARDMKSLRAVMHVSTAYCNCPRRRIDEVLYDVPLDCDRVVQLVNAADERVLERITPALIDKWPNSYAYTKAVGEDVIKRHRGDLPVGVFRPAIVINSAREPFPGWIDNLYGPGGVVLAAGSGLMHTLHAGKDKTADLVPVDLACNALLAAAWETASLTPDERSAVPDGVPVYNYVSSVENRLDWKTFMHLTSKWGQETPSGQAIWIYSLVLCDWRVTHLLLTALLHFLPALFVDLACICIGSPFRLVQVYKKISKFSDVIAYFATNEWEFHNDRVRSLWRRLRGKDRESFNFDIGQVDWDEYFHNYVLGMRKFMFKEDIKDVPKALARRNRFWWAHQALLLVTGLVALRAAWIVASLASGWAGWVAGWASMSWLPAGVASVAGALGLYARPTLVAAIQAARR